MRALRPITLLLTITSIALLFTAGWLLKGLSGEKEALNYEPRSETETTAAAEGYKGAAKYYQKLKEGATHEKIQRTRQAVEDFAGAKDLALSWSSEGPVNQGGRTRAILIKNGNPSNMWVGGVSGGLWRSSDGGENWEPIPAFQKEVVVSDIVQLGNGDIFVSTGSVFENPFGQGSSGFYGRGLYYTTDNGQTFEEVPGTIPDTNNSGHPWNYINELAADPTNNSGLWIAHAGGLKYYDASNGNMSSVSSFVGRGRDVALSSDGSKILATNNFGSVYYSNDGGDSFQDLTAGPGSPLPSGNGRMEAAISKTDDDFMYVLYVDGNERLETIQMSRDGGDSWGEIAGQGSGSFKPFYNGLFHQGFYDNAISVRPGHPGHIVIGGITLWEWKSQPTQFNPFAGQWSQMATNGGYPGTVPFYVHSDIHDFAWNGSNELYVGTDGGVFLSSDGLETFVPSNKGFVSTQFYAVEFSKNNQILGGTQDNGTQYLNRENRWKYATRVRGNDGFDCEISHIDPTVLFATIYGNQPVGDEYVQRSETGGDVMSDFLNTNSNQDFARLFDDFRANIALYEDPNDTLTKDSLEYVNFDPVNPLDTTVYQAGDTLTYRSNTLQQELQIVLDQGLDYQDTITLPDPVQSLFAFTAYDKDSAGAPLYVYLTRDALNLEKANPSSFPVLELNNNEFVDCYEFSADGNYLWVGTTQGNVYRIAGLDSAYGGVLFDSVVTDQLAFDHSSSNICTGISVDPSDPAHVALSFGGYGGPDKVLQSFNATDNNPSFSSIWDNSTNLSQGLINMPVYDVLIEMEDPNVILAGTEYGVFATDDGGNTWSHQNAAPLGHVPVFDIEQQTRDWTQGAKNPGYIYLGSHGKGFFKTTEFRSVRPDERIADSEKEFAALSVYPNPADQRAHLELPSDLQENVRVRVYDLKGKEVRSLPVDPTQERDNELTLSVAGLEEGIYLVRARSTSYDRTAKLVVSR